ncbi:MAG: alpha/beta fold hydrolase [Burkholderiales bacterium]|nr:alpha/beta fold hydrolase [Burkholderiales bacterium]
MLPTEPRLETFSRAPRARSRRPPLLFVHGGYTDGWCWTRHFLGWFAERGWPAHALSLRGHGGSGGAELLFASGLDDYAADVERVAGMLPEPPVFVGHSMGAAIVERMIATHPRRGAVLLAPVPPTGLATIAARLAVERPDALMHMMRLDPTRLSAEVLAALRPFYFSDRVDAATLASMADHIAAESPRAILDLSLRLHWVTPERNGTPLAVIGAEDDRICSPDEVRATARHHGVEAAILPGLAHMLMLEPGWEAVAEAISRHLAAQ